MEHRGQGSQAADIEEKYLRDRIVILPTTIDDFIADRTLSMLRAAVRRDRDTGVWLLIKSPGGSVEAGLRIMEAMDTLEIPVGTFGVETVEGVAVSILAHGVRGHRRCHREARIRLRPVWCGGSARQEEVEVGRQRLCNLLAGDAGRRVDGVAEDMAAERAFTADEAVGYGLVDRAMKNIQFPRIPGRPPEGGGPGMPRRSVRT